jgi:hypothetical protein
VSRPFPRLCGASIILGLFVSNSSGCGSGPTAPSSSIPLPTALLKLQFDSFGAAFPIVGLSPIQFDARQSTGEAL